LNLGVSASLDSQQQQPRRRTNRVHNQRKNTGRIIWNDVIFDNLFDFIFKIILFIKETKEVEIRDDSNDLVPKTSYQQTSIEDSHRSDDQKLQDNAQSNSGLLGSRGLISRFEHNPPPPTTTKESTSTNLSPTSPPPSSSSTSRTIRSQSQDPSRKSLTTTSLPPSSSTTTNSNNLMNGMASSTPFSVKKDSKENSLLNQGISSTNNDASAIKRVNIYF
jgi:hypothetical protein